MNYATKKIFPLDGMVFGETEKILLKSISQNEYENYMNVSYECSIMKEFFKDALFKQDLWETFTENSRACFSIYDKPTNQFIGYCGIKNLKKEIWELEMELLKKFRNQGYGYHALQVLLNEVNKLTGINVFRCRVDPENYASQSLLNKLGAKPNGTSELFLQGDHLLEFQNENQALCDDPKIIMLANQFNLKPIDIIGHVLEYQIIWNSI